MRPYDKAWYWHQLVQNETPLWSGAFLDLPFTTRSCFLFTGFYNLDKELERSHWIYFPEWSALLGFLKYVYFPTALFQYFDTETEGFQMPVETFETVLSYLQSHRMTDGKEKVMEEAYQSICEFDHDEVYKKDIERISHTFNQCFRYGEDKRVFFKVFQDADTVGRYMFEGDYKDLSQPIVEEDLGLSRHEVNKLLKGVTQHPFYSRHLLNILNERTDYLLV